MQLKFIKQETRRRSQGKISGLERKEIFTCMGHNLFAQPLIASCCGELDHQILESALRRKSIQITARSSQMFLDRKM